MYEGCSYGAREPSYAHGCGTQQRDAGCDSEAQAQVQRAATCSHGAAGEPPSGMRKRDANASLAQTRGSEFISRGEHGKARGKHEIRSASMQKTRGLIRR